MQNINWNGVRLRIQSYNVQVGTHQLALQRCFRHANGIPVFIVPGFCESSQVFLAKEGRGGLAPFLASLGYDVYLADLRGKGNSWPSVSRRGQFSVHAAICDDIPAYLAQIDKLRPGEAQFWIGQGFGSLLLLSHFARTDDLLAPVIGISHFAAARRCELNSTHKIVKYRLWNAGVSVMSNLLGYVGVPFGDATRRESSDTLHTLRDWHTAPQWLDPEDQFDYGAALQQRYLPPSLYIANQRDALWGNAEDCRRLISELGPHDGRMVIVSKRGGNLRNYSSKGLLRHPMSCDDHFLQLHGWLEELAPGAPGLSVDSLTMGALHA